MIKFPFRISVVLFFFLYAVTVSAQITTIRVDGEVYDPENHGAIANLMVVNKRTQQGYFADNKAVFTITIDKKDTLIIAATGFSTTMICFKDSALAEVYKVRIALKRLQVQLKPVDIITKRDLEEIQKDIETLGYDPSKDILQGIDAIQSPITYLYEMFSRRERNKRLVAEMRNNDRRRGLLKELFHKYVDNDIIQLNDDEFDNFIDFCGVSDEFMKSSTQYEFIMYIKKRFEVYRMMNR